MLLNPAGHECHCGVVLVAAEAVAKHEEQEMAKLTDTQLIVVSKAAVREEALQLSRSD